MPPQLPPAVRTAARVTAAVPRAMADARRQLAQHTPRPPAAGLVLDLGSGQAPDPRADVIVDKYVADDFERGSALVVSKPLVVADGHALPFADDRFAYLISAHVLEHATDPVRFAGELQRVARAGFVQVPSREAELTFGWAFHPWLIDLGPGDVLRFAPREGRAAPVGELFHRAYEDDPLFALWWAAHRDRWHHTVHWSGALRVEVQGTSRAPATAELDVERTLRTLEAMRAQGPSGALRAALRCPVDRGALADAGDRLACADCGRSFPVAGGVPVLLAEAAA
jgi:SAM-dependent methyltransferase